MEIDRLGASVNCIAVTPQGDITPAHYTIGFGVSSGGRGSGRVGRGRQSNSCTSNGRHRFLIGFNPKTAKYSTGGQILWQACNKIYTKSGQLRVFYPTTDITPALVPIVDITKKFPTTESSCQDFFCTKTNNNATQVTFYILIEMPEGDIQLHQNTLNSLRANNLWMDNGNIKKTRKQNYSNLHQYRPSKTVSPNSQHILKLLTGSEVTQHSPAKLHA